MYVFAIVFKLMFIIEDLAGNPLMGTRDCTVCHTIFYKNYYFNL